MQRINRDTHVNMTIDRVSGTIDNNYIKKFSKGDILKIDGNCYEITKVKDNYKKHDLVRLDIETRNIGKASRYPEVITENVRWDQILK